MSNGELWFNKRPQGQLKWRTLLYTGPGEIQGKARRASCGGQGKVQPEHSKTWAHVHIRVSQAECFGVSQLKLDWSNQTKQSGILLSSTGALSKRCTRGRPWEAKESDCLKGCWGSRIRNLYLLVTIIQSLVSIQGPRRLLNQTKWMCRQQYYGVVQLNSQ